MDLLRATTGHQLIVEPGQRRPRHGDGSRAGRPGDGAQFSEGVTIDVPRARPIGKHGHMTDTPDRAIGLVLDCVDPERLAAFWAPALGYVHVGEAGAYPNARAHRLGIAPRCRVSRVSLECPQTPACLL